MNKFFPWVAFLELRYSYWERDLSSFRAGFLSGARRLLGAATLVTGLGVVAG